MAGEDELVNFILHSREKRRTDAQIVRALLSVGWKRERVEAAFRIVREKEFISKQEAERGDDELPDKSNPAPAWQTQQPANEKQAAPAQQPGANPLSDQASSKIFHSPEPAQIPSPLPAAKKQPFSFPNIFGKKAQVPSVPQAQPAPPTQAQSSAQQESANPQQQDAASSGSQPSSYAQQKGTVRPPPVPRVQNAQQTGQQPIPVQMPPQTGAAGIPSQQSQLQLPLQIRPEPKTGMPIASLWPSGSPTEALPYELPYQKVADESQVTNPAFAKIGQAATKLPENKFLPIIAVAFIVLLFVAGAAYYFLVLGGSSGPRAPAVPPLVVHNATNISSQPPASAPNATNISNAASANSTQHPQAATAPSGHDALAKLVGSAVALPPYYRISSASALGKDGSTEQMALETTYVKGGKIRRDSKNTVGPSAGIEKRQYALGESVYDCVKIGDGWSCGNASYRLPPPSPLQLTPSSIKFDKFSSTLVSDGTMQISGVTASCFNETVEGGYAARFCVSPDGLLLYTKMPSNSGGRILDLETTRSNYTAMVSDSDFELPSALAANATAATPKQAQSNSTLSIPILIVPQQPAPAPVLQPEPKIIRIGRYVGTGGDPVIKFCRLHGGVFLQAHYTEFWGTECVSSKGRDGFANQSQFPEKCEFLSCCADDPSKSFSRGYDYFECGYYD